mmetsp:Transcript_12243/g.49158  ORF Transcript_12243/g.49158 Transcript_12243/m.49158 type:complete len:268 (+) Transcript_12243:746-1549(+)
MSLLTENFSMYSDMSMRTSALGSLKRKLARLRHSWVLPTPVGPRKRKEPMGRSCAWSPARLTRTTLLMALMASSWPTTSAARCSSMWRSFARSPSKRLLTGTPVVREMTLAMSSAVTASWRSVIFWPWPLWKSLSFFCSSGMTPNFSSAALLRSPIRSAWRYSNFFFSSSSFAFFESFSTCFSSSHCFVSSAASFSFSWSSFCTASLRATASSSVSFLSASASIFSVTISRSIISMFSGLLSCWRRSLLAASSMRSMALSGRNLSVM